MISVPQGGERSRDAKVKGERLLRSAERQEQRGPLRPRPFRAPWHYLITKCSYWLDFLEAGPMRRSALTRSFLQTVFCLHHPPLRGWRWRWGWGGMWPAEPES